MASKVEIPEQITVGDLAEKLSIPVTKLIGELMKAGVMATVNERIDFDTAQIIVTDMDEDIKLSKQESGVTEPAVRKRPTSSSKAKTRPPVVAVMGHVDHGKTSLLDAIRDKNVVSKEAGGITQHISAYQISHNKRKITFLDTPGHEAFAALREHGAHLTDVVVIVVAADDGVKPQTTEAIRFAQKAGVKIIVAISKIDKPEANKDKVKQQLADQKLLVEEWGGDVVCVPVSAKTKEGISDLLDMVLLVADVEDLRADIDGPALGLIIEAHKEQGRGLVARALVESGTLEPGQYLVAGSSYARVRNLELSGGGPIKQAKPSTPVIITGFKTLPSFGDAFEVVATEKSARKAAELNGQSANEASKSDMSSSELIRIIDRTREVNNLNVIIKADVQGSLTSVLDGLKGLNTTEVAVRVVSAGIGDINENDVHLAHSSGAVIYGFNVGLPVNIKRAAVRDKVTTSIYKVIYELLDDVKEQLTKLLVPEVKEAEAGRLIIKAVFKTTKSQIICGGEVTKGKLVAPAFARIYRDKDIVAEEVELVSLKRGPQDTKEVQKGEMCGMSINTATRLNLQEGDRVEVFTRETLTRKL